MATSRAAEVGGQHELDVWTTTMSGRTARRVEAHSREVSWLMDAIIAKHHGRQY